MRRTIWHSLIAVILGITLPMLSAVALIQLNAKSQCTTYTMSVLELKQTGNDYEYQTSRSSSNEVEGFAVSFIIAMVIYLLFKRKTPHRTYRWVRTY